MQFVPDILKVIFAVRVLKSKYFFVFHTTLSQYWRRAKLIKDDIFIRFPACLAGWTLFQNFCYFFEARMLSQPDAEANCQALGGNLASVHSAAENNFLLSKLKIK